MKIERKRLRGAEVYTSSLNDIMFFLLLFFLIISTMVAPAMIKVLLPDSVTAEKATAKKSITLVANSNNEYFIDDRKVEFEEIEPILASIISQTPEGGENVEYSILLQADASLNLQHVVNLIDIGNKLKVKVLLSAKKI